ncbi:MAG: cobalamin-dependent protein, partial [Nanoarchaeota archaeon]|nr:cobalamin-dependent protein [Nanoarchaeota archaeon]
MLCDVLFIHIPRLISKSLTINLIPIGIFSIADFISNRGISTKILHMGIEQELNAKFDVAGFIKENNISIICLDLHWHHSAHVTLKEAERIKGMNPDCKIVLGGNTSSFF